MSFVKQSEFPNGHATALVERSDRHEIGETGAVRRVSLEPEPPADDATPRPSLGVVLATTFLLAAASAVPVWMCDYFPSHNGPSLLNVAYMQYDFDNPRLGYAEHFDLHPFPVPYLLQTAVLNSLFPLFTPLVADKIWITLLILLRPGAMLYFLRGLGRGREIYALACIPLLFDFSMMRGYSNFHAGVSLGFVVFGFFLRHRHRWRLSSTALFHGLVLLQYFAHPVALAVTGLLLAAYEFAATRSVRNVITIVLRGYLPAIALLAGFMWWSSEYGAWVSSHLDFNSLSDKVQNLHFRGATPLSPLANFISLALLLALGVGGLIALLRKHGAAACTTPSGLSRLLRAEPILASVAIAWIIYLLMPWKMTGWHKADVRIIPIGFMLVLAVPPALRLPRRRIAFMGVTIAASLACIALTWPELKRRSDVVVAYCAGISATPDRPKILALFEREPRDDQWRLEYAFNHLQRTANYYTLVRGGATTSSLAENNTLYWVWFKDYRHMADFPKVNVDDPQQDQIAAAAAAYDTVLLWGGLEDVSHRFSEHGFQPTFHEDRLTVLTKTESNPTLTSR